MTFVKQLARKVIFPSMMGLRFDRLIRNTADDCVLNVMYHGVVQNDSQYFSPRHITKEQFEAQLQYFKKHFNVLSIPETFHQIRNTIKPNRKSITISFDDGFKNNLYSALPLLEKYDVPATVFVLGSCAEKNETSWVWSAFTRALHFFHPNSSIALGPFRFVNQYDNDHQITLENYIKSLDFDEREHILSILNKTFGLEKLIKSLPEEIWKLLSKEELIELSRSKHIQIGSHGYHHYNLGNIKLEHAKIELERSKNLLETTIGQEINMIAYPDGSYSREVKELAEKVGYKYQLAVDYKTPNDNNDPRILNRHGLSTTTTFDSNMIMLNLAFRKKGIRI
ncbi:MAG: polysaccharide deacetylase family protein [Bacteroidia bacterium]|nr:polysaccharide deacetylase family protein [Bacteroidia bacterium]